MARLAAVMVLLVQSPCVWSIDEASLLSKLLHIREPSNATASLSPDGSFVAIARNNEIHLLRSEDGRIERTIGPGFLPQWSPNGMVLAFYSRRSGQTQLWVWSRKSGAIRQLTRFPQGIDPDPTTRIAGNVSEAFRVSWSTDGMRIVFASRVPNDLDATNGAERLTPALSVANPKVLTLSTPPEWTLEGVFRYGEALTGTPESRDAATYVYRTTRNSPNQLFIAELETGSVTKLTHSSKTYFHPTWSPNGRYIAYSMTTQIGVPPDEEVSQIAVLNLASMSETTITNGAGVKYQPHWSRDGRRIAYLESARTFNQASIFVTDITDIDNPVRQKAIPEFDRHVMALDWSTKSDALLFIYKDGTSAPLGRTRLGSAAVERLSGDVGEIHAVKSFSQSAEGAILWIQHDPERIWSMKLLKPEATHSSIVTTTDAERNGLQLGTVLLIRWRNRRGDELEGSLLFPPEYQKGKPYPLIVDAYPLRSGADWTSPLGGNYAWAAMGYVVFRPSPRAPHAWVNHWKSEASSSTGRGPEGWDVAVDDVLSGVDELVRRGIADRERMCLFGFSNGATVVNHLVTQTDRFRCAVSVSPALSNWVRRLQLTPVDRLSWLNGGTPLEEGLSEYIALSPVFKVASVNTPMLLAAGDNELQYLLDAIEMYSGLRRYGKNVVFVRYPGQGHGLKGDALQDFWERSTEFLRKHLSRPRE